MGLDHYAQCVYLINTLNIVGSRRITYQGVPPATRATP